MENTKNNNETMNDEKMYSIALETSQKAYAIMKLLFEGNEHVTFSSEVCRWQDRSDVRVYASLTHNSHAINDNLRELVGNELLSMTLAKYSYTEDIAERFLLEVESVLRVYARRAKIAKEIIDSKK